MSEATSPTAAPVRPAKAAPKPVPRERGRGKGAKERVHDERWKRKEREVSRFLQDHDGPTENPTLRKLQTSTGRLGHLTDLGFDSVSRTFLVEVKCRNLPLWQHDAWTQICQLAEEYGASPLLALTHAAGQETYVWHGKTRPLPDMYVLTGERLRHLLELERQVLAREEDQ